MDRTFTKRDSQAMKGIAIWLMLFHHLFYSADSPHGLPVSFLLFDWKQVTAVARFCKICVPAFVFVTAYGMTMKYKTTELGGKSMARLTVRRYLSLMVSFLFIYVLAFVFCQLGGMRSWSEIYGGGGRSVLYAVLDMLGMTYLTETPTMNPTWWYMTVAVALIFVLPFLWLSVSRSGAAPAAAFAAVMYIVGLSKNQGLLCILTATVGVWCSKEDVFGRAESFFRGSSLRGACGVLLYALLLLSALVLKVRTGDRLWIVVYPVSAFALAGLLCRGREDGALHRFFGFFGKYSMYMFLTHTFLKSYYLHDFIYGFRYGVLIFAVLVLLSLALAAALAAAEKGFRRVFKIDERLAVICDLGRGGCAAGGKG